MIRVGGLNSIISICTHTHNHRIDTMGILRIIPVLLLLLVAFQPAAVLAKKRSVVIYQDPPTMNPVITGNL